MADLPVTQHRREIIELYEKHNVLLIIGETGSGKTTQIPKFIYEYQQQNVEKDSKNMNKVIAITQPRRVAAMSIARRVAEETGTTLGQLVGYSVRFDEVSSPATRIKFLTDGMLLREAMSDPLLSRYSTIVLDEAHERTLRTDIMFGIVKRLINNKKRKCPLKVVVMSATMNPTKFLDFFNDAHLYRVPGRVFPVRLFYTKDPQQDYLDSTILSIFQLHMEKPLGDILVFLTGQEEIEATRLILEEHAPSCPAGVPPLKVCPIYATLPAHQQMAVFSPAPSGHRKVILATNIAETSITIPGIKYVVDPGFVKMRLFTPRNGMETLAVLPVSKASARQRCGRAGREQPGECYRLYMEDSFKSLDDETPPEILRTNLANVILIMKGSGIDNVIDFDYLDPPSLESLKQGLKELLMLGALDHSGNLTEQGKLMAECPLAPMLSRVLLESVKLGCAGPVITILSMLSAETIFVSSVEERENSSASKKNFAHSLGDHLLLFNVYRAFIANKCDAKWCRDNGLDIRGLKTAGEIRNQLTQFCERNKLTISDNIDPALIMKSFTAGYFMQCAYLQPDNSYKTLVGRQTVYIHPSSILQMKRPSCVIYNELTLTTKCYLRNVGVVEASWINEYYKAASLTV